MLAEKIYLRGLSIWQEEEYRKLQGTYPVISLSFANIKERNFTETRRKICQILVNLYTENRFLLETDVLGKKDLEFYESISADMGDMEASFAIYQMARYLSLYYNKKVILLLDEYDTPMQEAYINGYWEELAAFTRSLFNTAFKTNPYMERAIMTGITRVSKESIFSDLNNLKVVTTTSDEYGDIFGFTESEVFAAMDEFGMANKEEIKEWYDGFVFGNRTDIYNPWSIINFLDTGRLDTYWANTSANSLIGKLIREGSRSIKEKFELLLSGKSVHVRLDEQIVYNQLDNNEGAVWSLLLASGYVKVLNMGNYSRRTNKNRKKGEYELMLTNLETQIMFEDIISDWFGRAGTDYNDFVKALLQGDIRAMNTYMNLVALNTFSYFDTGKRPSGENPERFYHGFVLGLLVELSDRYILTSNRESGFGRYDVLLEPLDKLDNGMILEFKVHDPESEKTLQDTVTAALKQIENMKYEQILIAHGVAQKQIRRYGFAFEGKRVLIGSAADSN